ncbi:MAG: 16S rRNA (guanine(966)-N(2))-methyltransferase RsmD [Verrucomicrobiaceae bacterium]|nr:16S rRNA (guanine(966)-N(2))-methyltransferase RsmD [Verrucomicrobiaceae bacterium]
MRIIAGTAGSIPLKVPPSLTRPTADRVREAVFSVLGDRTAGARVLDLFAGSGSLGLEALSRGASEATFVESHGPACTIIGENLRKTLLTGANIQRRDVFSFLATAPAGRYDLVFADPPYARDEATLARYTALLTLPALAATLVPDGIFVLESGADTALPETPYWEIVREKTYGGTRVSYLAPIPAPPFPA